MVTCIAVYGPSGFETIEILYAGARPSAVHSSAPHIPESILLRADEVIR